MISNENRPSRHVNARRVCEWIGHSRVWLYREVKAGRFPKPFRFGARNLRWDEAEVAAWLETRRGANEAH